MAQINHQQFATAAAATTQSRATRMFQVGDAKWSGYDLETFLGGLMFYREVCSPEKSFHSKETICRYQADVKAMQTERANAEGEAELTEAEFAEYRRKRIVLASATSPDSERIIPWFSRTSAFVPMSVPISVGMVLAPPTQLWTVVWQVVNTTYCAALNHSNGSSADDGGRKLGPAMQRKKELEDQ